MRYLTGAILILCLIPLVLDANDLQSYVIDCGSISKATSNEYVLSGSVGQSLVGDISNDSYSLILGFWTPGVLLTYISEHDSPYTLGLPIAYSLSQSYPNPAHNSTKIQYSLPKRSKIKLQIFDVIGRRIAVLIDEEQEPGYYKVNWSINDVTKQRLANGIYFYRLDAGEFTQTKKMIICR